MADRGDTVMLYTSVEYSRSSAEIPIDELIAELEAAKEDGATHIVASSGNHRGAKFARIDTELETL